MALADVNFRDMPRLLAAFREARGRNEKILPTISELLPAMNRAAQEAGDPIESLVLVFGEPFRRGADLVRKVMTEKYGAEYTDDLWQRLRKNHNG